MHPDRGPSLGFIEEMENLVEPVGDKLVDGPGNESEAQAPNADS